MYLNCTINANPLTNKNYWRKEGNSLNDGFKYEIKNLKLNEFTYLSQLIINYYDELDQGLYECSAENDLKVAKIVYNLRDELTSKKDQIDLIPIGSSIRNNFTTTKQHQVKTNRKNKLQSTKKQSIDYPNQSSSISI